MSQSHKPQNEPEVIMAQTRAGALAIVEAARIASKGHPGLALSQVTLALGLMARVANIPVPTMIEGLVLAMGARCVVKNADEAADYDADGGDVQGMTRH